MSYFDLEQLNFRYPNQKTGGIEDFSMSIDKGEIVALLGKSGSGKSTILRLISGLETPKSGTLRVNQKIIFDHNINLAPQERGIGMIFQDYSLFPHLTVLQNVMFGVSRKGKKEREKKAMDILAMVQLQEHARKYPQECSGGQQQRIAIARALAAEPNILLLDEPFSNLDEELKKSVREEIKDLLKKCNITAILVTHDKGDVGAVADRVLHIA
ncbi:MAG: ABC transporter ATP-binding protein [Clostridiales bacterium]|jgi:iron(III) transport system ATP-binding protein|nr:ABC transporter ATP-binding protein [Clostridiales bacterium]